MLNWLVLDRVVYLIVDLLERESYAASPPHLVARNGRVWKIYEFVSIPQTSEQHLFSYGFSCGVNPSTSGENGEAIIILRKLRSEFVAHFAK